MSIVQNLKLLNKPISELAMLPQETIMTMAQAGQIPVAFVAPILAQKADQAQTGAEIAAMAAQQKMPAGTVLEGLLAQNAANEAREAMPQMPEEMGIAALPVSEDIMPGYAGGGIVAFEKGGDIDYSQFGDLGEELKRQEEINRMYLGDNEALRVEREGMDEAARRQKNFRLMQMGLLGLGGTSPYFGVNLSKMAPAVEGMAEDEAAQLKRKVELAGTERAERAKVLEAARGAVQAREKLVPETIREARLIQEEARKAGKKVPTLEEAIKSIEKRNTTTLQSAFVNARTSAAKAVGELINSSTFQAKYNSIAKKEGREAAEAFKERSVRETVGLFPGVDLAEVMAVLGSRVSATPSKSSGTVDKNNPLLR